MLKMITHYCQEDILKSQLAVQFTILNECRAEFWEFLPDAEGDETIVEKVDLTKIGIESAREKKLEGDREKQSRESERKKEKVK